VSIPSDHGNGKCETKRSARVRVYEDSRIVCDVVLIGPGFGKPVAALVVHDDTEIRRKEVRAEEDERRPVASALVGKMQDEAVGLHELHGRRFPRRARPSRRTDHFTG
jgi:hypothetical protein